MMSVWSGKSVLGKALLLLTVGASILARPAVAATEVWIGNEGDNTLRRYDSGGTDLGQVASGLTGTVGVDTGPDGNIYVAGNDNTIRRFSPTGADLGVFASGGMTNPTGMVWDDDGNLLVMNYTSPGYIRKFSPLGADLGVFAYTTASYDLARDSDGNIYVSNGATPGTIEKYDSSGNLVLTFAFGGITLGGLDVGPDGNLYVADSGVGAGTVLKYATDGTSLGTFASGLSTPRDLEIDAAGNVFVSEQTANVIHKFDSAGVDLGVIGPAGLNAPHGIALSSGGAEERSWSNVLQPINADGSSIFKLGRTVPVKFKLTDESAGITDLPAKLYLSKVSNGIAGTEIEAVSTSAADSGNTFRYDPADGQYIFNLGTKSLSEGTWQLRIDLLDGVTHTVVISLRK